MDHEIEQEFEQAVNGVLDAANNWASEPNAVRRAELRDAVRNWRAAGQKLIEHARQLGGEA